MLSRKQSKPGPAQLNLFNNLKKPMSKKPGRQLDFVDRYFTERKVRSLLLERAIVSLEKSIKETEREIVQQERLSSGQRVADDIKNGKEYIKELESNRQLLERKRAEAASELEQWQKGKFVKKLY